MDSKGYRLWSFSVAGSTEVKSKAALHTNHIARGIQEIIYWVCNSLI
jgi:hypothetical protein